MRDDSETRTYGGADAAARFAPMKAMNARIAFFAWIISGGLLIGARGPGAFLTIEAAAFFLIGGAAAVHVLGYANFLLQRAFAISIQTLVRSAIGRPSPFAARFINGFGIGMLSGAAVMAWFAARAATQILFGPV